MVFSEDITAIPVALYEKEKDASYDVVFDAKPKVLTGTPAAGGPVV